MRLEVTMLRFVLLIGLFGLACSAASGGIRSMQFSAKTPEAARKWQAAAREKLFALMMGGRRPETVPLKPQVLRTVDVPGAEYRLEEITIQTMPDRRAHAWVAIPRSHRGKLPAAVALHGHGGSGEQVVLGEGIYWYGKALAQKGYAVIAPDIGSHDVQHKGWTLMGERTWDALRCIDYILSRPEVSPKGVDVVGLSLGGETTMYVAALDERVKLADSSGWLTTVANMKNGHCPCWEFPGLEESFDFADIFACIAPRKLICEIGEQEKAPGGFPVDIARQAFQEILQAYRVFGAEAKAVLDVHSGGHVFLGRRIPLQDCLDSADNNRKHDLP